MIKGIVPTLAEGGKIKIGGLGPKKTSSRGNEFRAPVKLDHFLVTTTQRNAAGDLIIDTAIMEALPKGSDGKCREIPIVLHDDDIERVFPTTLALYTGKKLACRGDHETAVRYEMKNGERTGNVKEMKCPCDFLNAKTQPVCKPHGTLHCSIRIPGHAVAGSVYKWRTTSLISIQRMIGSLQQILSICGTLTGVPLQLVLEPIQVTPVGAPASTVYCCHVELRAADIQQVQRQAIESAQMRQKVRALVSYTPPAIDESDDEESEVAQEFHPDIDPNDATADATARRQADLRARHALPGEAIDMTTGEVLGEDNGDTMDASESAAAEV